MTTHEVVLTFDDGPHAASLGQGVNLTEKTLDILKAKGVKAGFFIQTSVSYRGAAPNGMKLVERMAAEGHSVGIHTGGVTNHESHVTAQHAGRLESELESAKAYIRDHTGQVPSFVRPVGGNYNDAVLDTYRKVGLTMLLWDIDGDKGRNYDKNPQILEQLLRDGLQAVQTQGWKGSTALAAKIIVLYHDIQAGTPNHLSKLIDFITGWTKTTDKADITFSPF